MPVAAPIAGGLAAGAATALLSKGGSSSGNTTSQQSSEPWAGVQPHLFDIWDRARGMSHGSGISPRTGLISNMVVNRGLNGSPVNDAAQGQVLGTLNGQYADPYANGVLNDVMDMAKSKINSQFTGDNFGNSAHQEWLGRGITSAALPFASQLYQGERQRQMGAAALAPTLANTDFTDLGQGLQASRFQDDDPWTQLQRYQQLISGAGGGQATAQQPYFTNPGANFLGGMGLYGAMNQSGLLGGFGGSSPLISDMVPGQYAMGNPQYG